MFTINNLSMHYGGKILFTDVNLNLNKGNRYGLVGANGAGKSTFFKLLNEEEIPSIGEITLQKNKIVGWLRQDLHGFENELIINVVIAGKPELWKCMKQKEEILSKPIVTDEDGYLLGELEAQIADLDGYIAQSQAEVILEGLGIPAEKHYLPLSTLSGGYKLRVLLAQSLFQNPDVLLLDEPTNHLDIFSIKWLEEYLIRDFTGLLIFISHDSNFLNNLATHILDIDYAEITQYTGNYKKFIAEKKLKEEQIIAEKNSAEKRIAKAKIFIERFKAKASKARQAASKEKQLEKIEVPEIKLSSRVPPSFVFKSKTKSGKNVLEVDSVSKKFNDNQVLNNISLKISRGEKVAIIGQNGLGKSTLLKIITSHLESDNGSFQWGHETQIGYFTQDHKDLINTSCTVLEWLENMVGSFTIEQERRKILGQMLFSSDDVKKNVLSLSGGEAARLLFAMLILKQSNVIILDEPTNHMDIETISALSSALKKYDGTIIFVSHDRNFISSLATRIITLTQKGIKNYNGTYEDYEKQMITR